MRRRLLFVTEAMECSLCKASLPDSIAAHKAGWDWFTGYLPQRFVACARCLRTESLTVAAMRQKSRTKLSVPLKSPTERDAQMKKDIA